MNDWLSESRIADLRETKGRLSPSEIARRLMTYRPHPPLNQFEFVAAVRKAFPHLPLRVAIEASGWHPLCDGGFDDRHMDALLDPWLGGEAPNMEGPRDE